MVWNWIKDWIEAQCGGRQHSYENLRKYVRERWDLVTEDQLSSLIDSMKDRCLAVIEAEGGHTKY
jgi:ketohexokinase/beta-glucosidase